MPCSTTIYCNTPEYYSTTYTTHYHPVHFVSVAKSPLAMADPVAVVDDDLVVVVHAVAVGVVVVGLHAQVAQKAWRQR